MDNTGRFSEAARHILIAAQNEADSRRHNFIDTDHIVLAIVGRPSQVGAVKILQDSGADYENLSSLVGQNPYATSSKQLDLSRDARRMLELAVIEMKRRSERSITVEHMLVGLLQIETCAGVELLFQAGCDMKRLYMKMDVSLPDRILRQHRQAIQQAQMIDETGEELSENEGCLPTIIRRIKDLFTRG